MEQREIKFRAWDKDVEMMRKDWTYIAPESTRGLVLMQYTGLKDKNGKEIYEGDITIIDGIKGVVEFHNGSFVYKHSESAFWIFSHIDESKREIIGNIYESPELLSTPNPK